MMELLECPKTKVVHVITSPIGGGAEQLGRELNRGLSNRGVESYIVYLSSKNVYVLDEREYSLGSHSPRNPKNIYLLYLFFRKHGKLFSAKGELIVHSHLTWPLYYVAVAFLFSPFKLIYTEHSTFNMRRKLFWIKFIERAVYARYSKIICISKGVKNSLRNWLDDSRTNGNLEVIPNGSRFFKVKPRRLQREDMKLELISVGAIAYRKGFDIVLLAVANKRELVASYTIVGIGSDEIKLRAMVKRLGLCQVVRFVGWASNPEKYLHAADVAVVPSRWEGFGLAAVEALSAGLPVIASNVDGLREVLSGTDAAILIPPENHIELALAIEKIHTKLMSGYDYRRIARKQAMKFSFDEMVQKYAELYRSI